MMSSTVTAPASQTAAARTTLPVGLVGLGVSIPDRVMTNEDWEEHLDTSDEWIVTRTGIRERRFISEDQATSDIAYDAAQRAIKDAGLDVTDVQALIVATTSPDHVVPQTAPIVASKLGIEAPAFDVGAGCTGFVYGLSVGSSMVAGGLYDNVVVVGAEALSRLIDWHQRETAVLFGDGAGAVVLRRDAGVIGPFDLGSDGSLAEVLYVPAGGTREPIDQRVLEQRRNWIIMQGREVYRHAVTRMTASSEKVLAEAGLTTDDVDLFVGHQANARILEAVGKRLGITDERAFIVIERFGNTSAASIPLALNEARDQGRLEEGSRLLLTAFGAGLTWGSCLVEWGSA